MEPAVQPSTSQAPSPCNIVMKGAIASGVVYPPVISVLRKSYVFRRIGGTSAGAIAAAGTAAAEYRRQQAKDEMGFDKLDALGKELAEKDVLRNLFRPSTETKPLLDLLAPALKYLQGQKSANEQDPPLQPMLQLLSRFWSTPQANRILLFFNEVLGQWSQDHPAYQQGQSQGTWRGALIGIGIGLLIALAFTGLLAFFLSNRLILLLVFLGVALLCSGGLGWLVGWLSQCVGGLLGGIISLVDIVRTKMSANFFGICIGHGGTITSSPPTTKDLTDWLYEIYNDMAGLPKEKPLTFGDLLAAGQDGIDLRMVTSNLSHARPYVLPDDLRNFIWKEADLNQFFCAEVITHMKEHASVLPGVTLPAGYFFFPDPGLLPVVVAVRLSISFPLLISAIPLYTVSNQAVSGNTAAIVLQESDLLKNWFSDGGICANFPIQFFDEWLPTYPTFGINLTSLRPIEPGKQSSLPKPLSSQQSQQQGSIALVVKPLAAQLPLRSPSDDSKYLVYLPQANESYAPEWTEQSDLLSFLQAMLGTGLYHREMTQVGLPGYRERVVQIRLTSDEDGLHLDMGKTTIDHLQAKGDMAGKLLMPAPTGSFHFDDFRLVRLQTFMSLLDQNLAELMHDQAIAAYGTLLAQQAHQGYQLNATPDWCQKMQANLDALLQLSQVWQSLAATANIIPVDAQSIIQPGTVLQVVPEV